eukprot:scaffold7125_cov118-Isochrysis_galbana.AAC.6
MKLTPGHASSLPTPVFGGPSLSGSSSSTPSESNRGPREKPRSSSSDSEDDAAGPPSRTRRTSAFEQLAGGGAGFGLPALCGFLPPFSVGTASLPAAAIGSCTGSAIVSNTSGKTASTDNRRESNAIAASERGEPSTTLSAITSNSSMASASSQNRPAADSRGGAHARAASSCAARAASMQPSDAPWRINVSSPPQAHMASRCRVELRAQRGRHCARQRSLARSPPSPQTGRGDSARLAVCRVSAATARACARGGAWWATEPCERGGRRRRGEHRRQHRPRAAAVIARAAGGGQEARAAEHDLGLAEVRAYELARTVQHPRLREKLQLQRGARKFHRQSQRGEQLSWAVAAGIKHGLKLLNAFGRSHLRPARLAPREGRQRAKRSFGHRRIPSQLRERPPERRHAPLRTCDAAALAVGADVPHRVARHAYDPTQLLSAP